jgi:Tfp pilus assembly protein FimT
MKNAFSMIELIFIIVLIGILAKIGSSFIPDNKLLNDTHYVSMKIKEQQKNALGYDNFSFGSSKVWDINRSDFNRTCITCNKSFFESLDSNSSLNAEITCSNTPFCFDSVGRPYDATERLLLQKIDISVNYNGKIKTLSVLPMSGYVIINQIP